MSYQSILATIAALSALPVNAAVFNLNTGDASGSSSFNTAGNWSSGVAPAPGNTYEVSTTWLRTPTSGDHVFGGDALQINSGGAILNKNGGAQTLTSNLILNGGFVRSGSGATDPLTLAGTIEITPLGGGLIPDQSPYTIEATISGTAGLLTLANDAAAVGSGASGPGRGIDFTGSSTFTGNVNVLSSDTVFTSTSSWLFAIGATGINNSFSGTGTVTFDGAFGFDLSGAGTTIGDSWSLANVSDQSFGSSFTVIGFSDNGNDTWASGNYLFNEATGILEVIPEPSIALLGSLGLISLLRRRRN